MGIINRSSIAKALQPGVNKFWGMGYKDLPLQLTEIFTTETSTKAFEEDVQLVGTGLFAVKPEGSPVSYDSVRQGYVQRYNHVTYALGVIFTHEAIMDQQYDLGLKQAKFLGMSARRTQETVAANILNRAFNPAYPWADGKELIATDHPRISGGTWSNELATPSDLSHAALEQMLTQIRTMTDDRGNKLAQRGVKLVVPPELEFEARRLLETQAQPGTDFNDINTLTNQGIKLVVNNYLTDPDAWFVITDVMDGLKRFVREPVKAPERETEFDTDNIKFKSRFRESYGVTDPRSIAGSPGA